MIELEVWGPHALFTRPDTETPASYAVPTPSAARGIVEAIYYHPGLKWVIDRIYVLHPIQFTTLHLPRRRPDESPDARVLQDVRYVIQAHFTMTPQAAESDNPGKFQDIVRRRMARRQSFHTPYFGRREFPAQFRSWPGGWIPAIPDTQDLGEMLYDFDYTAPGGAKPLFFHAVLRRGVLEVPKLPL